MQITGTSLL